MESHGKKPTARGPNIAARPAESNSSVHSAANPNSPVVNLETWKKRTRAIGSAATVTALDRQDIRMLSRSQKQAALLRLILSDEVEETYLDAILQTALSLVSY